MTLAHHFMAIARELLRPDVFADIHARAVAVERHRVETAPVLPAAERVAKPAVAARVAAHLNDRPPPPKAVPHIAERLEERLDVTVGPNELGVLAKLIQAGGPNVRIVRRRFDTIVEAEVAFMGKSFVTVYNLSRNTLITAYPKAKKRPKVRRGPAPVGWREDVRRALEEM